MSPSRSAPTGAPAVAKFPYSQELPKRPTPKRRTQRGKRSQAGLERDRVKRLENLAKRALQNGTAPPDPQSSQDPGIIPAVRISPDLDGEPLRNLAEYEIQTTL